MYKNSSASKIFLSLFILLALLCSNPDLSYGSDDKELAYNNSQFEKVKLISRGRLINVMKYLEPHKYTVFMFYADWCAPCKPLKEKLGELAERVNNMALREIDIINLENPLVKYYNIPAIPYFLVYGPDGKFVERGPMLSKKLLKQIASENQ
ncbi:MAG: thioredoxin family protein [Deltaproteobacteria bacterium]|nr:thioredoxin family protein [Deltaproteobacteria bacterium]